MSIGKNKISGKALMIQLGFDRMRVAKATLGAAAPRPFDMTTVSLPEGAVADGVIVDPEPIRDLLKSILSEGAYRGYKQAVAVLCTTQAVSETAKIPNAGLKRLDQLIETNADMYFPFSVENYKVTYEVVGPAGERQTNVRLWAVPNSVLEGYYSLLNRCGLYVAAVDYAGHALAAAVVPSAGTSLYLHVEREQLMLSFVAGGQVRMQRVLLRGGDYRNDVNEVLMAADYFDACFPGLGGDTRALLCGDLSAGAELADALRDSMGMPVSTFSGVMGPDWVLCEGACAATLDFGDASMNKAPRRTPELTGVWQYGLVAAAGAVLTGALLLNYGSRLLWSARLRSAEIPLAALRARNAENADDAGDYLSYMTDYRDYSGDWNKIFGRDEAGRALENPVLQTYNDNLVLALGELEGILPKNVSVTDIAVTERGVVLRLACQDKITAAYTIIALRAMEYMSLDSLSDLYSANRLPGMASYLRPQLYDDSGPPPEGPEASAEGGQLKTAYAVSGTADDSTGESGAAASREEPPPDGRIFFDAVLGYREALRQVELSRRSLDYDAKAPMLEAVESEG